MTRLCVNRVLRAATLVAASHHPVEATAVAEVGSALLPLLRPRSVACLLVAARLPSFASTLLSMAYRVDPHWRCRELVFLALVVIYLNLPAAWSQAW